MGHRAIRWALAGAFVVAGCSLLSPPGPGGPAAPAPPVLERIPLEPSISPMPFRWLGDDALLVDADATNRGLAALGNYIGRRARKITTGRVAIWDDEAAWSRVREGRPAGGELEHKRAQYLKESGENPLEEFAIYDREGHVVYERNFRDYPLGGTDDP